MKMEATPKKETAPTQEVNNEVKKNVELTGGMTEGRLQTEQKKVEEKKEKESFISKGLSKVYDYLNTKYDDVYAEEAVTTKGSQEEREYNKYLTENPDKAKKYKKAIKMFGKKSFAWSEEKNDYVSSKKPAGSFIGT